MSKEIFRERGNSESSMHCVVGGNYWVSESQDVCSGAHTSYEIVFEKELTLTS